VQSAWREPDAPPETAVRLAAELHRLAEWLGLAGVIVRPAGNLAFDLGEVITTPVEG
jgi:uncharacterized protein YcaQ